jgi:hypothetical protein
VIGDLAFHHEGDGEGGLGDEDEDGECRHG